MAFMFDSTRLNELYQRHFNLECKHVLTSMDRNDVRRKLCSAAFKNRAFSRTYLRKTYSNISDILCAMELMTRQLNS